MEYRNLGRTGLKVSEICLGTMTFGWTAPREAAAGVFDAFFDQGGNFFDTADVYSRWADGNPGGVAEELLGGWLQGKPRDQVVIATKVFGRMGEGPNEGGLSRGHIMHAVEESLRRLQTDYIDLYQSHSFDENTPLDETLHAFDDLIRQGKVRYLGCSNHQAWQLIQALWVSDTQDLARYVSIQPRYSLLMRADFERELQAACERHQLGVIPYSPLAGGVLTGKYHDQGAIPKNSRAAISQWVEATINDRSHRIVEKLSDLAKGRGNSITQMALGWMLSLPVVTSPIVGVNTVKQWEEIAGAAGLRLSDEEMAELDQASAWRKEWGEE